MAWGIISIEIHCPFELPDVLLTVKGHICQTNVVVLVEYRISQESYLLVS